MVFKKVVQFKVRVWDTVYIKSSSRIGIKYVILHSVLHSHETQSDITFVWTAQVRQSLHFEAG